MKFVCMKCEKFMMFEKVENPASESLGVTFGCPSCGNKVAMVTNPGETSLVHALGVKLGGRTAAAEPMELTRETLKEGAPATTAAATATAVEAAVEKSGGTCPFSSMLAGMGGAEGAKETGPGPISWSAEAEERLSKIPTFMRPMVQMGIEAYAKKNGVSMITAEVMDASRNDSAELVWTAAAESRLSNIPSFIRPMARKEIERIAKEKGYKQIDERMMDEAKEKFMSMGY